MLGKTLGGFRIEEELGSGGMGTVWRAVDDAGLPVAIKVVHPHLIGQEGFFKRFLREAEIGRSVTHPNVVRTLDIDAANLPDGTHHFLVMEYVEGQTLRQLLEELGRLPEELCRHVGREIAKGLAAIHAERVVHRDVKPANVLITKDHAVKVMDLGVARLADEMIRLSRTGMFVGSLEYAAPEQFEGGGADADERADLFALGVVLAELASGSNPFHGEEVPVVLRRILTETPPLLTETVPAISPFFAELVRSLLEKDRTKRLGPAAEIARLLEEGESSAWWRKRAGRVRSGAARPIRRPRLPRETAVHGREEELDRLSGLFESAASGEGRVLLIEGEAGVGKTRLVDAFLERLRDRHVDHEFLFASFPPGGAATASGAFVTAFRESFPEDDLDAELGRRLSGVPGLVPAFAAALRGEPPAGGSAPLGREALQTAFVEVARSFARERPTVLLIDDLQHTSDEGRGLFAALAHAAASLRLLLVGTHQAGLPEGWGEALERLPHTSRTVLPRLGARDLGRLLVEALGSEKLAGELTLPIATRSDGNPYFVFEILRDLKENGTISRRDDGSWRKTRTVKRIELPTSVRDLIRSRMAGLSPEEQELLDVAACCGGEFDAGVVADTLGMPRIPVLRLLSRIESRHRLVRAVGRRFAFDHLQVREHVYERMPEMLREEYHLLLAKTIEGRSAGAPLEGPAAYEVALHHLAGGAPGDAVRHVFAALDHLQATFRPDAAADLAGRVLAAPGRIEGRERLELLIRAAACLDTLGRKDEQERTLEEAETLAGVVGDRRLVARVLTAKGWSRISVDRFEEARELLARAREIAVAEGDETVEGTACQDLGIALFCLGRPEEARACHERHLEIALRLGDRRAQANATGNLGNVLFRLGRKEEARKRYEEWLGAAREIGDRRGEAAATGNLGTIHYESGEFEEARLRHERYRTLCREIGYRRGEQRAGLGVGRDLAALGRYAEAVGELRRSAEIGTSLGQTPGTSPAEVALAEVLVQSGDLAGARRRIEDALDRIESIEAPGRRAQIHHAAGRVATADGRPEEAEGHFGRAIATRREAGDAGGVAESLVSYGRAILAQGRDGEAADRLREALAVGEDDLPEGAALLAEALLARLGGPAEPAIASYEARGSRLTHGERIEVLHALSEATGDPAFAGEARRLGRDAATLEDGP